MIGRRKAAQLRMEATGETAAVAKGRQAWTLAEWIESRLPIWREKSL